MGLLWDLMQSSDISAAHDKTAALSARVDRLERDVEQLSRLVTELVVRLERRLGEDLDGDGRVRQ